MEVSTEELRTVALTGLATEVQVPILEEIQTQGTRGREQIGTAKRIGRGIGKNRGTGEGATMQLLRLGRQMEKIPKQLKTVVGRKQSSYHVSFTVLIHDSLVLFLQTGHGI